MSRDPFPEHADLTKLFARNGSISAVLPLARLGRLVASLADPGLAEAAEVLVDLAFGHDDEGRRRLQGSLQTSVRQLCQRCLQPLKQDLHSRLDLLVLDSEQELKALPGAANAEVDAIVDETGELDLLALIEDELLLSLPLVPKHEDAECSAFLNELKRRVRSGTGDRTGDRTGEAIEGAAGDSKRANPFAVLAALKQDKNGNGTP